MLTRKTQPSYLTISQSEDGSHSLLCSFLGGACSVAQSCLTLCGPMDRSPPGSSVHETLQARISDLVAKLPFQGIFLTQGSNLCLLCLLHW